MTLTQVTAQPGAARVAAPQELYDPRRVAAPGRHVRRARPATGPALPPPAQSQARPPVPGVLIAGAHGGAGASTLAALLRLELGPGGPPVHDLETMTEADPRRTTAAGWQPALSMGMPLILAARGTAEGARRAVTAVAVLAGRGIQPDAVAIIADGAGPEPRQAAQRYALIAGRAGPLIRVPFAAPLRAGTDPAAARLPRGLRRALADLAALAGAAPGRTC